MTDLQKDLHPTYFRVTLQCLRNFMEVFNRVLIYEFPIREFTLGLKPRFLDEVYVSLANIYQAPLALFFPILSFFSFKHPVKHPVFQQVQYLRFKHYLSGDTRLETLIPNSYDTQ